MTLLKDRKDAGQKLAEKLKEYAGKEVVVLGLPRGGVVLAASIAKALGAPLDLAFAHKIGHPDQPEYAIAAMSESGHIVGNEQELSKVSEEWIAEQKKETLEEIQRRRELYLKGREKQTLSGKIVILADDGIATGLTMKAAIEEIKSKKPQKFIAAVPVAPESTANSLDVDEVVAIQIDPIDRFLGSVGAYYEAFPQVSDQEVVALLEASS